MSEAPLFVLRRMRDNEHPLVIKSWLNSYRGSPLPRMMADEQWAYYAGHHRLITEILARGMGVVAHVPGDEDTVLGWCVYEPEILHYVFVKPSFRGARMSRALVMHAFGDTCDERRITYSHKSPDLLRLTRETPTVFTLKDGEDDGTWSPAVPPKLTLPDAWVHCFYAAFGAVTRYRNSRKENEAA